MSGTLSYVYAVGRDPAGDATADLAGIDDAPVRVVREGDLAALVSDVDDAVFEQQEIEKRLEDLTWLSATARAHHGVVDHVGARATIVPLALATVYFDDDRVRAVLRDEHDTFAATLDRLDGRTEWGIKGWARSGGAQGGEAADGERPRSGADYLRRRRQQLRAQDQGVDAAMSAAEAVHERAAAAAIETRRHRPHEASLSGATERMVLNGAYLVDGSDPAALQGILDEVGADGPLRVELTGPWVPYSFVRPEPAPR